MPISDDVHRRLFDASPNPCLVLDRQLHIVSANRAYLAATRRRLDEIVGRRFHDAFPTDPETERQSLASIERVIRTGQPDTLAQLRFDIRRAAHEGGGVETRYWNVSHTPVPGAEGEVELVQQSLQAGVDRLTPLFQKAPGFMAVLRGPRHVCEFANDALHALLGRRDYVGKPLREALPELEAQGVFERLGRVYASGQEFVGYGLPVLLQRADGGSAQHFINLIYQPIVEDGAVTGIFVEGSDVTEQHLARALVEEQLQELQRAERRLGFQLELADRLRPLASSEAVIGAASQLLGRYLGLARVAFAEIAPDGLAMTVRRDWCRAGMVSVAGIQGTLDDFGAGMAGELRLGRNVLVQDVARDERTAEQTEAYAALGVRSHLTIPLTKDGRVRAVLSLHDTAPRNWTLDELRMAQDMAERTWAAVETARAQAELRAERDQSQYIFDTMTEGFAVADRDWTIVRMNATGLQLVGRSAEEVVGHNHWEVFPEVSGTELEGIVRGMRHGGQAGGVEYPYALPQGGVRWMEVRVFPAMHDDLAIFFRDITARRNAEDQLRLEAHRKDEFLAMLAHELRNPLAPIGAAADLLVMGGLDPARMRRTSAIITRQVRHMTSLIDDLLDVSRVTRGLVTLEREPVDVKATVADAVEQVRPLIEARRHRLEVHLAPEHALVEGDRKRLVQVLANLLGNAAKYTPEGGRIVLEMQADAGDPALVTLSVTDSGIGMTPAVRDAAFELFTQAERTPDRSQGGLGIGLALVKSLVELHGGAVTAYSDGPGTGSRFTVQLPRMRERRVLDKGDAEPRTPQAPLPAAPSRRRVLVVDDNVDAAQLLAMVLENLGYEVLVEHDPHSALAVAAACVPEVCILDIGLPDMDGNELARRLRRQSGTEEALLIAVTGYGRPQDREQALAAGFDHHLVKPVDVHRLVELLADVAA